MWPSADESRHLPPDARAGSRRRLRDLCARADSGAGADGRARLRGVRADDRARRRGRPADSRRRRVPRRHDHGRPHRGDVAGVARAGPPAPRARARVARRRPFPAQRRYPAGRRPSARSGDDPRPAARALPAVLLPRRARLSPRRLQAGGDVLPDRDRDLRARTPHAAGALRARPDARGRDPARRRPRPADARRPGARAVSPLPREPLAAQEPCPAVRGVRARAPRPARPSPRAHRHRPRGTAPGRRREPRTRVATTSWSSSTAPRRHSSSRACTRASGCRRSRRWPAGARSRRRTRPRCPRSAATRPSCSTRSAGDMARAIEAVLADPAPYAERGLARRARSAGARLRGRTRTSTGGSRPANGRPVGRVNAAKRLVPLDGTPGRSVYAGGVARLRDRRGDDRRHPAVSSPPRGGVRRRPRGAAPRRDRGGPSRRRRARAARRLRRRRPRRRAAGRVEGRPAPRPRPASRGWLVGEPVPPPPRGAGASSAARRRRGREPRARAVPRAPRGGGPRRRPDGDQADGRAAAGARVARRPRACHASSPCPTRGRQCSNASRTISTPSTSSSRSPHRRRTDTGTTGTGGPNRVQNRGHERVRHRGTPDRARDGAPRLESAGSARRGVPGESTTARRSRASWTTR